MTTPQIPVFSTLYKNKKNNKFMEWSVCIVPVEQTPVVNSTCPVICPFSSQKMENNDKQYDIMVTFGEHGGNSQTHIKRIERGKANRTTLEQATLEAKSKWNDKIKEGYMENIKVLDIELAWSNESSHQLQTQSHKILFRPMLAQTFSPELYETASKAYKIPFPACVQRKYDGIRCTCRWMDDGENGHLTFETRKGIEIKILREHTELINELSTFFYNAKSKNVILDGELYTDKQTFETLNGLLRLGIGSKTSGKITVTKETMDILREVEFHVYDMFCMDNPMMKFENRNSYLENMFNGHYIDMNAVLNEEKNEFNKLKKVVTETVECVNDIKSKHDEYVCDGYEGIIIRDMAGVYEVNKRSKYLQKYKEFMEEEFVIVGFHDGEGIDKELVIWECLTNDDTGKIFSVRPKLTHERRKQMYENGEDYVGKKITVIFQEYSNDGIPRFPVGKEIRDVF